MVLYKTYKCDVCGALNALHLEIPHVDDNVDPAGNQAYAISGYVDLCKNHLLQRFPMVIKNQVTSIVTRRAIWKQLCESKVNV